MSLPLDVDYLTAEDLLEIAAGVLADVQIRDAGLLASAAARPATAVFGTEPYPTLAEKAAALLHSLVRNHPLVDGNKRLGWSATRAFCLLNGFDLRYDDVDDAEALVVGAAAGSLYVPDLAAWTREHLVPSRGPSLPRS